MESFLYIDSSGISQYYENVPPLLPDEIYDRSLKLAIDKIQCPSTQMEPFVVADFGSADGKRFLSKLSVLKEIIWKKFDKEKEMLIVLEDISTHFLNSVWKITEQQKNITILTSGTSFYQQCVPSNTFHYGQVIMATHWFNNGNLLIRDSIFPNTTRDMKAKQLVKETAAKDWELFLCQRAKELAPGGTFYCCSLGYTDGFVSEIKWNPLNNAWEKLHSQGYISELEKESCVIQEVTRSEEEHQKPFLEKDSLVSRAGLHLVHFEVYPCNYFQDYKNDIPDRLSRETTEDIRMELAIKYCKLFKAIYYTQLYKALSQARPEEERSRIMLKYFEYLNLEYFSNQKLLDVKADDCCHIMIMRKD